MGSVGCGEATRLPSVPTCRVDHGRPTVPELRPPRNGRHGEPPLPTSRESNRENLPPAIPAEAGYDTGASPLAKAESTLLEFEGHGHPFPVARLSETSTAREPAVEPPTIARSTIPEPLRTDARIASEEGRVRPPEGHRGPWPALADQPHPLPEQHTPFGPEPAIIEALGDGSSGHEEFDQRPLAPSEHAARIGVIRLRPH